VRRRRGTGSGAPDPAVEGAALRAASLLLGYPDAELLAELDLLERLASALPERLAAPLSRLVDHLRSNDLRKLQEHYTDTFDLRRRCCLYLTYFTHGDTRQRGMALLRFSHAYRSAGVEFAGGELPDHLAVVCEFAAIADLGLGLRLLGENRAGLELVRSAVADVGSPYVDVLDLVRGVLGPASAHDLDKALELARSGPPEEEVGLEPFGPPELMGGQPMGARR
jgi:nitrate reductase delta subunit